MVERYRPKAPLDHGVGYRRPPKESQFKPGRSGNPAGRPKGSRSIGAILHGIFSQKIHITEDGVRKRLSALEVMLRRLRNDAMQGDPKALKLLLSLHDRYAESPDVEQPPEDLAAEDRAILDQYLLEHGLPAKHDRKVKRKGSQQ